MTLKAPNRDYSLQNYVFIPRALSKLPEVVDSRTAMAMVRASAGYDLAPGATNNRHALAEQRVSDRLSDDPALAGQVHAYWMTDEGLLIRGTQNAAFKLNDTVKAMAWLEEGGSAQEWSPALSRTFSRNVAPVLTLPALSRAFNRDMTAVNEPVFAPAAAMKLAA